MLVIEDKILKYKTDMKGPIIVHSVFIVIWIIFGMFQYKAYIKRKISKERAIKKNKNSLILFFIIAAMLITYLVFVSFNNKIGINTPIFLYGLSTSFLPLSIYLAGYRYLLYLEDNKEESNLLED